MKKLIVIMLVAMIPFITMAQKRGKKNKNISEESVIGVKISNAKFMIIKGFSFTEGSDMMEEMIENEEGEAMQEKLRINFDFGSINQKILLVY